LDFDPDDAEWPIARDQLPAPLVIGLRKPVPRDNGFWKREPTLGYIHTPARVADRYADMESRPFLVWRLVLILGSNESAWTERRDNRQQLN
jgi:hypothetical protein